MTSRVLIDGIDDWLVHQATGDTEIQSIVEGFGQRVAAAGLAVARMHVSYRTLHPLFASQSVTWSRDDGLIMHDHAHAEAGAPGWQQSPLHYLVAHELPTLRRRLRGPDAQLDFPILEEFAAQGFTDYIAFAVPFDNATGSDEPRDGMVGSWSCDRPSGFTDRELQALERLQPRLALACKVQIKAAITRHILSTYLGEDAGRRVLHGQIRRGDFEPIRAVIWYSDMRESTVLAERLDGPEFMAALDDYFECSAGAVVAHDGEVLRFVGDAVLAIFPIENDDEAASVTRALTAAADAFARLGKTNQRRAGNDRVAIDFGLGLHLGEVMFGNMGIPQRLEFSVIGPAVNLVARLENLTKTAGRRVLASDDLARYATGSLEPLGEHTLRGVAQPLKVHALPL